MMNYDIFFVILQTNMNVLNNIKTLALKVWRSQALKYTLVCLLGVLVVGFLDENSIWNHFKNQRRINELEEEIGKYNAAYERDQAQIRQLNKDPKAMEKIARERYFMKADDEDIYVLSDDERGPKTIVTNETTN
jgi:cell division protein FtsB